MAKRFYFDQYSSAISNAKYTVEIHDSEFSGTAIEIDGSFTLRIDEGKVSDLLDPLLPSIADINVNVRLEDTAFETFLAEIPGEGEERYTVKIFRDEEQIWTGQLPTDLVEYPDQYYTYNVTLSAICGLVRLKNIKYDNAGEPFEGRNTILGHVINCLTKLGYDFMLGAAPIVRISELNWLEDSMLRVNSGLETIDLAYDCFQEYDDFGVIDSLSCWDVLQLICRRFHYRMFMAGATFYMQQVYDTVVNTVYTYSAAGVLLDTSVDTLSLAFTTERTEGAYRNYPPVREISLIYNYKQGINRGNMLPANYTLGTSVSLGEITGGAGEVLRFTLNGSIRVIIAQEEAFFVRYRLYLKVGDKYLTGVQSNVQNNVPPTWSDTAGYFIIEFGPYISVQTQPLTVDILTPPVDPGGVGTFNFEYVGDYLNVTTPATLVEGSYAVTWNEINLNLLYENDEAANGKIKFTGINTSDGTTAIKSRVVEALPDTIIGDGPRVLSSGRLRVHNGLNWENSDSWAAFSGGTYMNINKLSLQETLAMKRTVIKAFDFMLQTFCMPYHAPVFNTQRLLILGYELDPDFDSVILNTVFYTVDRTNIVINSELDAPDQSGSGSGGGSSVNNHARLHDMTSILDHAPATGSDKGKFLGNNSETGNPEWMEGGGYWTKTGTELKPATEGDSIYVETSAAGVKTISAVNTITLSSALFGKSSNGFGIEAESTNSSGGKISGVNGLEADATSGSAIIARSINGLSGYFQVRPSGNNIVPVISIFRDSSSSASAGIGSAIDFNSKQSSPTGTAQGRVAVVSTDVNLATVTSDFVIQLRNAGAALAEKLRLTGAGECSIPKRFKIGTNPVPFVIFKQTADKSITNTTTETSLFGTGQGSLTIPANMLVAGDYIRVNMQGFISSANSAENFTFKVKLGSTTLVSITGAMFPNLSEAVVDITLNIAVRSIGSSGSVRPAGNVMIEIRSAGYAAMVRLQTSSDVTIDTTSNQTLDITGQWQNDNASNSLLTHVSTVEII